MNNVLELVHDGWFILICFCVVCAVLSVLAVRTRENGVWESMIVSRIFLLFFIFFWSAACIQGWKDIKIASAVDAIPWVLPFLPICAALLVFGGTFVVGIALDKTRKNE